MDAPVSTRPRPRLRLVLGTTAALVILYEIGAVVLIGGLRDLRLAVGLAGPAFLLLPLLAVLARTGLPVRSALGLRGVPPGAVAVGALAVVAAAPAVLAIADRLVSIPPIVEEFFDDLLRADSAAELLLVLLVAAIAPAVSEELVFRGWLQRGLRPRLGGLAAVAISATTFGLIHGPSRAPAAIAFGALLGWLAHRSGSVVPSVAAHVAVNALAIAIANAETGSTSEEMIASGGAPEIPWTVAAASVALSAAGFVAFGRACPPAPSDEELPPAP